MMAQYNLNADNSAKNIRLKTGILIKKDVERKYILICDMHAFVAWNENL